MVFLTMSIFIILFFQTCKILHTPYVCISINSQNICMLNNKDAIE